MFYDPLSGKFRFTPDDLADVDPLLLKSFLHPESLTPEETREISLRSLSFLSDYLEKKDIEELVATAKAAPNPAEPIAPGDVTTEQIANLLEGKIALRELGLARRKDARALDPAALFEQARRRRLAQQRRRAKAAAQKKASATPKKKAAAEPKPAPAKKKKPAAAKKPSSTRRRRRS